MKRFFLFIVFTLSIVSLQVVAQSDVDALRYSRTYVGGSARFMSMGGAFGALGAELSTLSTNPAGLGLYKKSEFLFTPSFYVGKTESDYYGTARNDSKYNFNLSNVGMVFTSTPVNRLDEGGWRNFQFAIGMNRYNNFNNRMFIEGVNNNNSMIDTYVDDANGIHFDEIEQDYDGYYGFDLNLAWWTYLLDTIFSPDNYVGAVPYHQGGLLQRSSVESWGSMNEMVLSVAANYSDRLYLGATFGFPYVRYFEQSTYTENDFANSVNSFKEFVLHEDLETRGTGFNFKFGFIFRATDWIRIGGAVHTPTFYNNMRDEWRTRMESYWDNYQPEYRDSPNGYFEYKLTTPMRAMGSVAFVIKKQGLISAEYEYVDYSEAKLRSDSYSFFNENDAVRSKYTSTGNLRLGAEWRIDMFALRGGYGIYGSPFKSGINDGERVSYSCGFGFREKNYFIDFAYVRQITSEDYYLYGTEFTIVDPVKNDHTSNNFMVTLGFRY